MATSRRSWSINTTDIVVRGATTRAIISATDRFPPYPVNGTGLSLLAYQLEPVSIRVFVKGIVHSAGNSPRAIGRFERMLYRRNCNRRDLARTSDRTRPRNLYSFVRWGILDGYRSLDALSGEDLTKCSKA